MYKMVEEYYITVNNDYQSFALTIKLIPYVRNVGFEPTIKRSKLYMTIYLVPLLGFEPRTHELKNPLLYLTELKEKTIL